MVKPLHAGLAARNGVVAALLAQRGLTASDRALDGPQGFLAAMGSERLDVGAAASALGSRWEIVETGITVKLYPSCAATHPALDALLDLRNQHGFGPDDVETVEIGVDAVTPTVLIYDRPASGLEGKFSMPYCAAAALVFGEIGIETFESAAMGHPGVLSLAPRVTMHVDPELRRDAPALTQSHVVVRLRDGRALERAADGARGYPDQPAGADELHLKFRSCAARALPPERADRALAYLQSIDTVADIRTLTSLLRSGGAGDH
jgi:2-methylcitrate dehydratase PrpD